MRASQKVSAKRPEQKMDARVSQVPDPQIQQIVVLLPMDPTRGCFLARNPSPEMPPSCTAYTSTRSSPGLLWGHAELIHVMTCLNQPSSNNAGLTLQLPRGEKSCSDRRQSHWCMRGLGAGHFTGSMKVLHTKQWRVTLPRSSGIEYLASLPNIAPFVLGLLAGSRCWC